MGGLIRDRSGFGSSVESRLQFTIAPLKGGASRSRIDSRSDREWIANGSRIGFGWEGAAIHRGVASRNARPGAHAASSHLRRIPAPARDDRSHNPVLYRRRSAPMAFSAERAVNGWLTRCLLSDFVEKATQFRRLRSIRRDQNSAERAPPDVVSRTYASPPVSVAQSVDGRFQSSCRPFNSSPAGRDAWRGRQTRFRLSDGSRIVRSGKRVLRVSYVGHRRCW